MGSIRFAGVCCTRATMVGEDGGAGGAVECSEADGDNRGVFPSLAAHPL